MVGHWPFSEHAQEMTSYTWHLPVKIAGRKRKSTSSIVLALILASLRRKTGAMITVRTFEIWQEQYNAPHKNLTWLRCDKDWSDRSLVFVLWCELCRKYEARIKGQKNFSSEWIQGTSSQWSSSVVLTLIVAIL